MDVGSLEIEDFSYEGASNDIEVSCRNKDKCVSETVLEAGTPKQFTSDYFSVGSFSRKNAKEVGSNLKSLLALQQGKFRFPHRARAHRRRGTVVPSGSFAPIVEVGGGITAYHRRLTLEGDRLIEAEDEVEYGSAPGHLMVTFNLKDWSDDVMVLGSQIGLMCRATVQNRPVNCFSVNTGQSSPDRVIKGISNPNECSRMLKRLTVLHQ